MRTTLVLALTTTLGLLGCEGDLYRLENEGTGGPAPAPAGPRAPAPPAAYRDLVNPLAGDGAAATAGGALFDARCAGCHGDSGRGDGPRGAELTPAPADLTRNGGLSDGYLFWRISEGGDVAPFASRMPAFVDFLADDEIWQLVSWLRALDDTTPAPEPPPGDDSTPGTGTPRPGLGDPSRPPAG